MGTRRNFDKRVFGNSIRETVSWDISVKNNKKSSIRILVEEQFPVSQRKSIEVQRLNSSNAKLENETGKLLWEPELAPSEKKQVNYSYSVKYPKGRFIIAE